MNKILIGIILSMFFVSAPVAAEEVTPLSNTADNTMFDGAYSDERSAVGAVVQVAELCEKSRPTAREVQLLVQYVNVDMFHDDVEMGCSELVDSHSEECVDAVVAIQKNVRHKAYCAAAITLLTSNSEPFIGEFEEVDTQ